MRRSVIVWIGALVLMGCSVNDICRAEAVAGLGDGTGVCFYQRHLGGKEDDPRAYLDAFLADLKRYGMDYDWVLDGEIEMRLVSDEEYKKRFDPIGQGGGVARASGGCRPGHVNIWIKQGYWFSAGFGERLATLYHELSHDVLDMAHSNNIFSLMYPDSSNLGSAERIVYAIRDNFHDARSGDAGNMCTASEQHVKRLHSQSNKN